MGPHACLAYSVLEVLGHGELADGRLHADLRAMNVRTTVRSSNSPARAAVASVVRMHIWLPTDELAEAVGCVEGVTMEVVDDWSGALPPSRLKVEVVVPPQAFAGDFAALTRQLPRLRVVQALSAGVDQYRTGLPPHVDLFNASGVHVAATAEWVMAAVLGSERNLFAFERDRAAGTWRPRSSRGLFGARVIVVGAGEIGTRVAELLMPFGAKVTLVGRTSRLGVESIDNIAPLLHTVDIVVLLVPHTQETERMVDAAFLARLRTGSLLVNAARGAVVDSVALLEELEAGRLRAALDVFDPEPPPHHSPLWNLPNVLLTPHVASNVAGMVQRQADLLRSRIPAFNSSDELTRLRVRR